MNEQIQKSLEKIKAKITPNGIRIPDGATLEQWSEIGRFIFKAVKTSTWWIADWAAFGDIQYGKLEEFCSAHTELSYQTVRNLASVARAVELSRRRDKLSFSHHAEVAALPAKEQSKWLALAEEKTLTVVELRRRIRESTMLYPPERTNGPTDDWIAVEKIFLDASDIFGSKKKFIESHRDEAWKYAQPMLKKVAEVWPDKVRINT